MAKPKAKKARKKEKKNVVHGQAHIKSTFNNTIVTITDLQGNTLSCQRGQRRIQGLQEVHALRRAARRREGGSDRAGARTPARGRVREGPGFGP